MIQTHDQLGNKISLKNPARRIISLVPSITELLYDLGLNDNVIGITKFCIHPKIWFETKERIGGTKNIDLEKIDILKPDLIIANKEENTKEQIQILSEKFTVYISDVNNLEDAKQLIIDIGILCERQLESTSMVQVINDKFKDLLKSGNENKSVSYFIWQKPYLTVGKNTFIDAMLQVCGLNNAISESRYPEVELKNVNSDFIFLSTEPFPFNEDHVIEIQKIMPYSKVILVDGEMFSWYGSRLILAADYFQNLKSKYHF